MGERFRIVLEFASCTSRSALAPSCAIEPQTRDTNDVSAESNKSCVDSEASIDIVIEGEIEYEPPTTEEDISVQQRSRGEIPFESNNSARVSR